MVFFEVSDPGSGMDTLHRASLAGLRWPEVTGLVRVGPPGDHSVLDEPWTERDGLPRSFGYQLWSCGLRLVVQRCRAVSVDDESGTPARVDVSLPVSDDDAVHSKPGPVAVDGEGCVVCLGHLGHD